MIEIDGTQMQWTKDMTVASVLSLLDDVDMCAVVRLNGKLVSSPDFEKTRVPNQSKIELLPLVAGG